MQDQRIAEHVAYSAYVDCSLRPLQLLKKIERACFVAGVIRDVFRGHIGPIKGLSDSLPTIKERIPEDELIPKLLSVEQSLELMSVWLREAHDAAKADPLLREEDGVAQAYGDAVEALCDLHAEVQDYRWAVMHHNAFLEEPSGQVLSTSAEIEKYLASL